MGDQFEPAVAARPPMMKRHPRDDGRSKIKRFRRERTSVDWEWFPVTKINLGIGMPALHEKTFASVR